MQALLLDIQITLFPNIKDVNNEIRSYGGFKSEVMGIDASLVNTGVAIIFDKTNYMNGLKAFSIVTQKGSKIKLLGPERLKYIITSLEHAVREYRPRRVIVENYSFGSHSSAYDLAELGGLIRILLSEYLGELELVPPTTLKKNISGNGNAKKEFMMMNLLKNYGIESKDNNQCDAICLALYGIASEEQKLKALEKIAKKKKVVI